MTPHAVLVRRTGYLPRFAGCVLCLLWTGAAFAQGNAPPLGPGAEEKPLPPNHPPMQAPPLGPGGEKQPLPPNHPPTQAPPLSGAPGDGEDLLKRVDAAGDLSGKEKTFEVAAALGKLYYGRARYADSAKALAEAEEKGEEARALFLAQRKKAGALSSPEEAGCPAPGAGSAYQVLLTAAKEKAKAGQAKSAATCARVALDAVLEVQELRARNAMVSGDPAGALKSYDRILEVDDAHAAALFGRGAVLLETKGDDLKALGETKRSWTKYLASHPAGARAAAVRSLLGQVEVLLAAGGTTKLAQKRAEDAHLAAAKLPKAVAPPTLTPQMMEAVQNTERTPELEQGLAKLVEEGEEHLARQRFQDALDVYKRVVPFQPQNSRAQAGMAWALVGLNRQPMADRVWSVAVGTDASAVDRLGDVLLTKGDAAGAKSLWTKLSASAPAYAEKLKSKLQ